MARVYSVSFFHYTRQEKILEKILRDGFKIFYCAEQFKTGDHKKVKDIGIPMVSFCNIPLSLVDQLGYGKFAIGMSKEWGIENSLTPVVYYPNHRVDNLLFDVIKKQSDEFHGGNRHSEDIGILGFAKPIRKMQDRKWKYSLDNFIEREWRSVSKPEEVPWLTQEEYQQKKVHDGKTKKPATDKVLKFTPKNVDFIIVKSDHARNNMINFLMSTEKIGGNMVCDDDRNKLISRILTMNDIKNNF